MATLLERTPSTEGLDPTVVRMARELASERDTAFAKVETLSEKVAQISEDLSSANHKLQIATRDKDFYESESYKLNDQVTALETKIKDQEASISELTSKLKSKTEEVSELETDLKTSSSEVESLETAKAQLEKKLSAAKADAEQNNTHIDELILKIESVETALAAKSSEVTDLKATISLLEENIAGLESQLGDLTTAKDKIGSLESQVTSLEEQLKDIIDESAQPTAAANAEKASPKSFAAERAEEEPGFLQSLFSSTQGIIATVAATATLSSLLTYAIIVIL